MLAALKAARLFPLLWLAGCGHAAVPPESAVQLYVAALERNDAHAAYGMLSTAVRLRLPESEFAERWRLATDERHVQSERLKASATQTVESATLVFHDGRRVAMARDGRQWRITGTAIGELHAATPEDALRLLVQALDARRYDLVIGVLAEPLRSEVERQLRERLEGLKAALGKSPSVEVIGDRARLQYDPRFRVELEREDGEWRILDLN